MNISKEEIVNEYVREMARLSTETRQEWLFEALTSLETATIRRCLIALPEERIIHEYIPQQNTPENRTWNEYRMEAIQHLKSLLPDNK